MTIRTHLERWTAPALLAAALALVPALGSDGGGVVVERLRVDPGRDPPALLGSLEGLGPKAADAIVAARARVPMDSPADVIAVPGVGPRLLHRWHRQLAFPREHP
jgi:hypothetical protein